MARLSTRNNPTGIKEIDRKRVIICVNKNGGGRSFNVVKLDLGGLGIDQSNTAVCVARAGKTSNRFNLGPIESFDRRSFSIDDLDESHPVRFRVLIKDPGNPRLIASVENLKPHSDENDEGESLIPVEPVDLGQLLWKLEVTEEGPVLKVNSKVFPHADVAQNDIYFSTLVLPEAFRNVLDEICKSPKRLEDESDWMWHWGVWLDQIGAGKPPKDEFLEENSEWKEEAMEAFCDKFRFANQLSIKLYEGAEV